MSNEQFEEELDNWSKMKESGEVSYVVPEEFSDKHIWAIIKEDSDYELIGDIPISIGLYHQNWKFIQDVCVRLSEHSDCRIRGTAIMGIEFAATRLGNLEKNIVKPVLLRALKDKEDWVSENAGYAIVEINEALRWNIGGAKRSKENERLFYLRKEKRDSKALNFANPKLVGVD